LRCEIEEWKAQGSTLKINSTTGQLRRGNADSHTKALGNLNAVVRPLRAALYSRLGLQHVEEALPAWRHGAFELEVTGVEPDAALDGLLDDPGALLRWIHAIAGQEFDDRNHAAAMTAAELHDAATPSDGRTSACRVAEIYHALMPGHGAPVRATAGWCAGGRCAGLRDKACLGDGLCFPTAMENAAYRGKDPLCQTCLSELFRIIEASKVRRQRAY